MSTVITLPDNLVQILQSEADHHQMMMTAVRAYATLGEITQALRDVFGEFREPVML